MTPIVDLVFDALFSWRDVESGEPCRCPCHPGLPSSDLHDFGFGCPCSKTAEDRRSDGQRWMADVDDFWASPKVEEITRQAQGGG